LSQKNHISSAGHQQPKLQDHGYGSSALRGVPVYCPAAACMCN